MRTIKFRAWDKDKKEIRHGNFMVGGFAGDVYTAEEIKGNEIIAKDRFELMQFTGLLDKNGKEIYEGDILEIDQDGRKMFDVMGSDGSGVAKRQVVGLRHGSWMTNRNPEQLGEENTYLWILLPSCEVIGNIYENPDLL